MHDKYNDKNSAPSTDTPEDPSAHTEKKIEIIPLIKYLGFEPGYYQSYFDLEGDMQPGTYPDLFSRDESKTDDIESKMKYISPSRAGKLYSSLLSAYISNNPPIEEKKQLVEDKMMTEEERLHASKEFVNKLVNSLKQKFDMSGSGVDPTDKKKKTGNNNGF